MNKEYKTFEELKEELGDKFEEFMYKSNIELLEKVNQLETKINTYENPEDMTLMFMWCDEKAKDKIKQLEEENKQLKDNWQQLKEWIKTSKIKEFEKAYGKRYGKTFTQAEIIVFNMIKEKIQELDKVGDK